MLTTLLLIYGLAIIVSMLIALLIRGMVVGLARLDRRQHASTAPPPAALSADAPPEHVAAIAAAIEMMVGAHRIVHIERTHRGGWVDGGRMAHHSSHHPGHAPRR